MAAATDREVEDTKVPICGSETRTGKSRLGRVTQLDYAEQWAYLSGAILRIIVLLFTTLLLVYEKFSLLRTKEQRLAIAFPFNPFAFMIDASLLFLRPSSSHIQTKASQIAISPRGSNILLSIHPLSHKLRKSSIDFKLRTSPLSKHTNGLLSLCFVVRYTTIRAVQFLYMLCVACIIACR
jgi:hypothetical protein